MKSLLIDNYDSFTYNLYQMLAKVNGSLPIVIKNDEISWENLLKLDFDNVIISPGPGHPNIPSDFGLCKKILETCNKPILGVCLGHQGICCVYGGQVVHAPRPMHGRIDKIIHNNDILFNNIPQNFNAVRYHSLISNGELPDCLEVIAWTEDKIIMGVRHKEKKVWGIQFHPESICSEHGEEILKNFKAITEESMFNNTQKMDSRLRGNDETFFKKPSCNQGIQDQDIQTKKSKTPYTVFTKTINTFFDPHKVFHVFFAQDEYAVWLDSSKFNDENSRFSFMGGLDGPLSYVVKYYTKNQQLMLYKKNKCIEKNISIFDFLKQELKTYHTESKNLPFQFRAGFVGYLGYELKAETAGVKNRHISEHPDAQLLFLDRVIAFDHVEKKCYLLCLTDTKAKANDWFEKAEKKLEHSHKIKIANAQRKNSNILEFKLTRDEKTYKEDIQKCLAYIKDGESYEICLTNKINADISIDPLRYYAALREANPAPYAAFLKFSDLSVACSSIERFMHIDQKGNAETKPIKGTLPRGQSQEEEKHLIRTLEHDEKFRSENLMIVDLLRNDLGKVCQIGSVQVPSLMQVETYATVHQLVSTIKGFLNKNLNAVDCIQACFPGGSMTGTPKIRTMDIIDRLETEARGIYSGCIGYFSLNGAADFNIVIRTAVITRKKLSIGIGGAIIDLSDPTAEYDETLLKAKALIMALEHTPEL